MSPAEIRRALERMGGRLHRIGQRDFALELPPTVSMPPALASELARRRSAVATHLALYPCAGCGSDMNIVPPRCVACTRPRKNSGVNTGRASGNFRLESAE